VDPVAGLQSLQLPALGVGGGELVAVPVVLLEQGHLHAGRDGFAADDDP